MHPRDDDVLENAPRRPPRGLLALVAAVGVVALGLFAFARLGDHRDERPARTAAPSSPSWPTAVTGCGDTEVPLVSAFPLSRPTGLQVLVGGIRLARLDVDTGASTTIADLGKQERWAQELVRSGSVVYAQTGRCDAGNVGVLRDRGYGTPRAVALSGPVERVIGGPAGVWGVRRLLGEDDRVLLRGIAGGDLLLRPGLSPDGVAEGGIVATGPDERDLAAGRAVYLLDPRTGRTTRQIGHGDVQGVGRRVVVWTGADCRFVPGDDTSPVPRRPCALHASRLDGERRVTTYPLPGNRTPAGPIVVSPDDRYVAFQLSRPRHELHFADRYPWTPSEVAVLDLHTKRLRTVPGLRVPARTTVGLAFDQDGQWLVLATNDGDHGRVFVWRQGERRLLRSPARLPGPLAGAVPVLVVG